MLIGLVLLTNSIVIHITYSKTAKDLIPQMYQEYQILTDKLDNEEMNNSSELRHLINEINSYNDTVSRYQSLRKNIWIGFLIPKEYDQLKQIENEGKK